MVETKYLISFMVGFKGGKSCAGHFQIKDLCYGSAHNTFKDMVHSGRIFTGNPALFIGCCAKRNIDLFAGDKLCRFRAIAGSENVRYIRAQMLVDFDRAVCAHFYACFLGYFRIGSCADDKENKIGFMGPMIGEDLCDHSIFTFEALNGNPLEELDPF